MEKLRFNARNYEYNHVNALACARISQLAYEDPAEGNRVATKWGFDQFAYFASDHHYGIMMGNAESVLIGFRGTDERTDWWTNLNIFFKRSPFGWVHRGFMNATESFWPDLPEKLSDFRGRGQTIWITGHSLGGALALLAAVKLHMEHGLEIAGIYTYGQPPVGRGGFCANLAKHFPNRYFRFVNHIDAVSDATLFFRHPAREVRYFDTSGKLWEGDPPWRVSILDRIRGPGIFGGLAEFVVHSMKNYIENLMKQESEVRRQG